MFGLGVFNGHRLPAHRLAKYQELLRHVVHQGVLDQLQHCGISKLVGQGCDHHTWFDFWHQCVVVIFSHTGHQLDLDLGQQQKVTANIGWVQHHLGMDKLYGVGTTFDQVNQS